MLYELVYHSTASPTLSELGLVHILRKASHRNPQRGITGCLLYIDREFLQIIEGEKEEVLSLFEGIRKDLRHRNPTVLMQGAIEQRSFPVWSMAFQAPSNEELEDWQKALDLPSFQHLLDFLDKSSDCKKLFAHISQNMLQSA